MFSLLTEYLTAVYNLTLLLSPYLLLGIFLSALIKTYIYKEWILDHLKSNRFSSVIKACLIGVPLPICSCGVMPIAQMLSKMGASRASIVSFLISTPMSGADAIVVYSAVFGSVFAALSVGTAFVTAVVAGGIIYLFHKTAIQQNTAFSAKSSPFSFAPSSPLILQSQVKSKTYLSRGFIKGCTESIDDLIKPLFFGILLAAMIEVFFASFITVTSSYWLNFLLIPIIAVPMYVCSISVIPVALSLLAIGFSWGMVFSFILIAPCVSLINLSLLVSFLSKKELTILLASVISIAVSVGVVLDIYFDFSLMDSLNYTSSLSPLSSAIETVLAIILVVLFLSAYVQKRFKKMV